MTFYTPLERLAKSAKECGWDVKADPETVLRLVEIAKAAEAAVDDYDCHYEPREVHRSYIAALRAALGTQPVNALDGVER